MEKEANIVNFISLDTLFEILGNPTRRVILSKIAKVPHSTSELANELGISRQAIHTQLKILNSYNIIEDINPDEVGVKFRIKNNISVRIEISPNYYNVNFRTEEINEDSKSLKLEDVSSFDKKYQDKEPNNKIKYLGEKLKEIDNNLKNLEHQRHELVQNKQCIITEIKKLMEEQYRKKLESSIKERRQKDKLIKESLNLGEEIFYTIFFNPEKYFRKINIDSLLDDLFFSDMDIDLRAKNRVSIKPLLKDLSKIIEFLHEDEDDWFFDI